MNIIAFIVIGSSLVAAPVTTQKTVPVTPMVSATPVQEQLAPPIASSSTTAYELVNVKTEYGNEQFIIKTETVETYTPQAVIDISSSITLIPLDK